eukprot:CAMPEP_0206011268 /NCGR_PEP_ID=MMETSP1464-20131121/12972_1 /ASSEMBLY_ACC=CAM_ASM_001124 /TAXON_ID=119497 /ORGANISM="Exanthemachrysis gayraliae, Strain RCC1523" /LENGTH=524 /DNA_ID=CAMNT_0053384923 /DNA_START=17 /DNA_END=1591 /DNA_ORIENTATION=+
MAPQTSWRNVQDAEKITAETLNVWPLDEHNARLLDNVAPAGWQNPTPAAEYDLVAIGAGSGGLVSAKQAARRGAKSALVEMHLAGGDCLNVGCVPSKALIRSARAIKDFRRAEEFGVRVGGPVAPDFSAIMRRMRELRAKIAPADSYEGTVAAGAHMFQGRAAFTGPHSLRVDGPDGAVDLTFKKAVIATGGKPVTPPTYQGVPHLTNETLYNLTHLPPRMVVIGGGPIGLEMAQCFAVFGAQVTVLVRGDKILPKEDSDAARLVHDALVADGLDVVVRTSVREARVTGRTTTDTEGRGAFQEVALTCVGPDGAEREVLCDALLVAAGRAPNVRGLGLEAAGVDYDERAGVRTDDLLRTSNQDIFAVGDVAHKFQFTHMSGEMAKMAVENALFGGQWRLSSLVVPWCTYTMPEVAHVGLYEHELDAKGEAYDSYMSSLEHNDRAILDGEAEGFVKITCKKGTDEILGATAVASHAGDLVAELTLAIQEGVPAGRLARVIHPYPTVGEGTMQAALGFIRATWKKM